MTAYDHGALQTPSGKFVRKDYGSEKVSCENSREGSPMNERVGMDGHRRSSGPKIIEEAICLELLVYDHFKESKPPSSNCSQFLQCVC